MDIARIQFTVPVTQHALEAHAASAVGSLENISLGNISLNNAETAETL